MQAKPFSQEQCTNRFVSLVSLLYSVFLPAADIPRFVGEGNVDLGITGQDMVQEAGTDVSSLVAEEMLLGFGKCSLQVQVPEADPSLKTPQDLVGKKVATSFDVLAKQYFSELDAQVNEQRRAAGASEDLKTQIEYVGGSVEAACALGVADGIGKFGAGVMTNVSDLQNG